jgi:rhamnosyltransferase
VRVTRIRPDEFGFGRTRDRVFEETCAPIVINLSQDAIPAHSRWLENLVAPLEDPAVAVSCGRSVADTARAYPQFPWERNGYFYFTREMKKFSRRYGRGLSNANSAIRRSVWEAVRFGEASIGEDYRFQTRLGTSHGRIAFPDDAPVLHHHNYTLSQLYKRCRNEGMGLREMGCVYSEADLAMDLLQPRKYWVWMREFASGQLTSAASLAFPVVRPIAVYVGSRFGRSYLR